MDIYYQGSRDGAFAIAAALNEQGFDVRIDIDKGIPLEALDQIMHMTWDAIDDADKREAFLHALNLVQSSMQQSIGRFRLWTSDGESRH